MNPASSLGQRLASATNTDWAIQFFGSVWIFIGVYASGIACKAILKFEPPAFEVALGGIITLALGRSGFATYETTRVRQTAIEHNVQQIPTTTPSPTAAGGPVAWVPDG